MKPFKLLFFAIIFSLTSHAQIDSLQGVYNIDSCDLESICDFLILDTSQNNIWEIGVPNKPFSYSAYYPSYAVMTRVSMPYDTSNYSSFELHIPNYMFTNMILGFRHKFQTDSLIDGGYVETSYDHGLTWFNAISDTWPIIFHTENFYSDLDTLKGGTFGFSGTSNKIIHSRLQWVWAMLVKQYPPDTLYIRFNFISDGIQTNKDGWLIDNFMVSYADLPGGIYEEMPDKDIKLYPNPFSSFTTINLGNNNFKSLNLKIYNNKGQIVKQENVTGMSSIIINKSNLRAGSYYVVLHTKDRIIFKDVLIVQ